MAYTELKEIAEKRFVLCFIFYLELSSLITYNSCIATQSVNITIEVCKPVIISAFWNNLCSELVTLKIETAFLPSNNEKKFT